MWVSVEPNIVRHRNAEEVTASAAAYVRRILDEAVAARGRFRIALAGGSTPRPIYERLAEDTSIDWSKVELFWGDERCVPPDHDKSNYRMVEEALLRSVEVPEGNVHRIHGEQPAAEACADYEAHLGTEPLDLVLLGMGDDGHTASLFPSTPRLATETRRVIPTTSPVAPAARLSLSLVAINAARHVALVVVGEGKASRLAEVRRELSGTEPTLPAAMVRPAGELCWLVDDAAAAELPA